MEKNLNKVRISKCRYLAFETGEQRNKFVLLYKDLFVPYSTTGDRFRRVDNDGPKSKQLLEGYLIDPIVMDKELKTSLMINIRAEDFETIRKDLKLKKCNLSRGRNYWSFSKC